MRVSNHPQKRSIGKERSKVKEFKAFPRRGNVVDMAVGIMIGAAFGRIIASLVNDVLMPPIGLLLGKVNFGDLFLTLTEGQYATLDSAQEAGAVTINYGLWFNTVIDLLLVAFAIFVVIRQMDKLRKKEEATPPAPPEPSKQELLLTDIRDLLKARS